MPGLPGVRREELGAVAAAFVYFFVLLAGYYVLRPIRDAMAVEAGVGRLPELFGWTFASMFVLVPAWSWLVARVPRQRVIPIAYEAFALMLAGFAAWWSAGGDKTTIAQVFFVWLSVYNVFVVSVFWAFMADLWREDQARRLYGLIAAGGSAGAIAGPVVVALFATKIGIVPLLIVAALLLQVAVACVFRLVGWARERSSGAIAGHVGERVGGGVFAGFRLAATSPYLAGIALMIALYALGSTTLYVEQTRLLKDALPDAASRASLLSRVDLVQNTLVALVEIVGTGWIMSRLGLSVALVVLPALTVAGLAVYGWFPTLPVLIAVGVARRVAHFALERPAREALFTVVTAEEKYKAKSFLDTVVYRGSDWLATQLQAGAAALGVAGPAIALAFAPVALVGLPLAFYLARRQKALAAQGASS